MISEIIGTLLVITGLAFLVETLVEAVFGRVIDNVPALEKFRWLLVYIAVAVGLAGAFVYKFDLVYLLARAVESPIDKNPYGIAITGISIGMGAAYIHQFISKFFPAKN